MKILFLFTLLSLSFFGYSQSKQEERSLYLQNKIVKEKIITYNVLIQLPNPTQSAYFDKSKLESTLSDKDGINYFLETDKGNYKLNCSDDITNEILMEIFLMAGVRPEQIETINSSH